MLAKVPIKRLDGKSSFAALTDYIVRQASAVRHSDKICGLQSAASEMEGMACLNGRVKDAVYHYVLSWRSGESPTDSQAFDAVTATLLALNMHDHQWIGAVHRNTQHVHAHVAVNRINPDTYKSVYPKGDWITLDRACRELEIRHGWKLSPGPHGVEVGPDATLQIVRSQRGGDAMSATPPTAKARNFAAWNRRDSFQEWISKAPADSLKRCLQQPGATWQTVHRSLATYDLEYRTRGSGSVVVDRNEPERFHARASHIGRFASLGQLVARLGSFETPRLAPTLVPTPHSETSYTRDVQRQLPPQDQRPSQDKGLFERYSCAKLDWEATEGPRRARAWQQQRSSEQERIETLRRENRAARERIKICQHRTNRRVPYCVQAYMAAAKREVLRLQIHNERKKLRKGQEARSLGTWREWLSSQAAAGDRRAMAAVRRIRYKERSERRKESPRFEVGMAIGTEAPRKALLDSLTWVADARGVNYRISDIILFRDEGRRVIFRDMNDDSVRAGLMLCREKWVRGICLAGTEEFKTKARELAIEMNIRIADPGRKTALDAPDLRVFGPAPTSAANSDGMVPDLELLSRSFGKPILNTKLRIGQRHTGKVIASGIGVDGANVVVIDTGRELAVVHTSALIADQLRSSIGRWTSARAMAMNNKSNVLSWRFVDLQRTDPGLERS